MQRRREVMGSTALVGLSFFRDHKYMYYMERAETSFTAITLMRVCEALQANPSELFLAAEESTINQDPDLAYIDTFCAMLRKFWSQEENRGKPFGQVVQDLLRQIPGLGGVSIIAAASRPREQWGHLITDHLRDGQYAPDPDDP